MIIVEGKEKKQGVSASPPETKKLSKFYHYYRRKQNE